MAHHSNRMKIYEILEHTADIRIRVFGRSLDDLFVNAAQAMFNILADEIPCANPPIKALIIQEAEDVEELFINWLNELLSLSAVEGLVFEDIIISDISDKSVEAVATGTDLRNYKVNSEIKAATYHQLKIEKMQSGWLAEVVFDV